MKRRFVLNIGVVLAFAIGAVGVLQFLMFRAEQWRLIDSRIESTASLLFSSDLSKSDLKEFEDAEKIVQDVVGGESFNQFVIIYNRKGQEVYRSRFAELPGLIPTDQKWQTIESDNHLVRVLTLPLTAESHSKEKHRILQTGLILDEDLLRWRSISRHMILFSILIIGVILLAAMFLAEALLRPLAQLAQYLRFLGTQIDAKAVVTGTPAPPILAMFKSDDEFGGLVKEVDELRERISLGLKNTQAWTAQMAHELKTPLTVLQNSLELAKTASSEDERKKSIDEATAEVSHLTSLISGFLEWTAAENFPGQANELDAVRVGPMVRELTARIGRQWPDRIRVEGDSTLTVFAKRGFVKQAITNLITNALRYSPSASPVIVRLNGTKLGVIDEGPGVPESVLANLGKPFNYGSPGNRGFGLGLAWVNTICHKYGWRLEFKRHEAEGRELTCAEIVFPDEIAETEDEP